MPFIPNDHSRLVTGRSVALSLVIGALFVLANVSRVQVQTSDRRLTMASLDFGETAFAREVVEKFLSNLKLENALEIFDRDQARAAARGSGYAGSLNLSLNEARNLGAVLGSDFFVLGDAQTLRRSPSAGPVYFEAYASIFLVSARTGRLISWERPNFRSATAVAAEHSLLNELSGEALRNRLVRALRRAEEVERAERAIIIDSEIPIIEAAPDDDKVAEAEGLRLPKPYRRFLPPYPETAAAAEAEAVVDVLVDLDSRGEITRAEVVRWAGFGLDQATLETVHKLHFFPAMREGVAVPIRVLLRYNFRKPPPQ
ncbi:MAG TPA: energy transducer TonB [Pyrinomonadaceae bacterium]|nr:energy transducer TonB [Pyrinomonadaceae bacterium]